MIIWNVQFYLNYHKFMLYPPLDVYKKDMNLNHWHSNYPGRRVLKYFDAYLVMKGIDDPEGDADGSCDEDEGAINLDTNKSPARGDY